MQKLKEIALKIICDSKVPRNLFVILFLFSFLLTTNTQAQTNEYPNIMADNVVSQSYKLDININFSVPGVLGLGAIGAYYKPYMIYITGEAGLGWTYKTKDSRPANVKWVMPWYGIKAGYPLHFTSSGNVKWAISRDSNHETYYRVKAPVHHFIVPEVGVFFNPVGYNEGQYMAKVGKAGLSWKTIVNSDVKVRDSNDGRTRSGKLKRYSEISVGVVLPLENEIKYYHSEASAQKSQKLGYYLYISFPYLGANWILGLNSIGYDDQAQFLFGAIFNIK